MHNIAEIRTFQNILVNIFQNLSMLPFHQKIIMKKYITEEKKRNIVNLIQSICIINGKYMVFLVFSILQKISTGYPILKFEFPLKICTKNVHLNMKVLSNMTPNQDRPVVHPSYFFPRFEPPYFLLAAFFFDGFLGFAILSSILETVSYNMTHYTFRYQKVNFTMSQVL